MYKYLNLLLVSGFFISCTSTQPAIDQNKNQHTGRTEAISDVETDNPSLQLSDYLRRIPGVQVTGTKDNPVIRVRVSSSVQSDVDPLFVIDNTRVGNSYQTAASMVDVNDIKKVTVLKDVSSTSMYGMQGANGVIVIRTK
ncbi:MAG: TonB-dependent receptor plug domain-containing protein [Cyclobacteriaceae bacterium]|nr:TonB-dependent receptor plug domain-containing protein [Cyclobacteriaceae bacterium]